MRFLLQFLLAVSIFAMPISAACRENINDENTVPPQKVADIIKDAAPDYMFIDVRTPGEFREGHLPGAKNIDFFGPRFEQEINNLPKDKKLVIYCRTGKRSAAAVESMREAGFANAFDMPGGTETWKKMGEKLKKD